LVSAVHYNCDTVSVVDTNLLLLRTKLAPFSWSDTDYLYYNIYVGILSAVGTVIWPVLARLTNWKGQDSLMVIVGIVTSIMRYVIGAIAYETWHFIAGIVLFVI
jgi:MFS-type transporter involved in bile tolerance (Atg22 family)